MNNHIISLSPPPSTRSASPGCTVPTHCDPNPCLNGAQCIDLWTTYTCQCASGYTGPHCEVQTIASFADNQFLHFPAEGVVSTIQFSFSVARPTPGIIMYMVSGKLLLQTINRIHHFRIVSIRPGWAHSQRRVGVNITIPLH